VGIEHLRWRRYAHLAADHLAPHAERLCALPAVEDEKKPHVYGTDLKNEGLASLQALDLLVAGTRNLTQKRIRIK
jgi:hypothetical protein